MNLGPFDRPAKAVVAALLLAGAPVQAWANITGAYYERAFVLAAHEKCDLFDPALVSALEASALQARGAALRAGAVGADLTATERRARARAADTACSNRDLGVVRGRVTQAFSGWSRMRRMEFPGGWSADRGQGAEAKWRLSQTVLTGASPVTVGMAADAGGGQGLRAVVSFVGKPRPYAARIVMRDVSRAPRPWLTGQGAAALPPETARRAVFAGGSGASAPGLLQAQRTQGEAWVFSDQAADLLAGLDPREPFAIEFLFRDDSVARATFQAGDFAAGRAFVGMGAI